MVTFILPGGSLHNKKWAEDCANQLKLDHEIRPVFWAHWDDPLIKFDPREKVRLIVDTARDNQINIVAKSIGTYVAGLIMEQVPDRIQKVVFCGIPLNDIGEAEKEIYKKVLVHFPASQILCFQNDEDPHGTYEQIKNFLIGINPGIKIIKKNRNDHEYPYYEDFEEFLKS